MDNYKPNSHKFKEEQKKPNTEEKKKVEKVVSGKVKTKKKNEIKKFADGFVSEDINDIKSYIISSVFKPAVKKIVSDTVAGVTDIIRDSIDTCLFGEGGTRRKSSSVSRVSYMNCYEKSDNRKTTRTSSRSRFDFDDIILETRADAEEVLIQMDEIISKYGMVSVADLYDMLDLDAPYTSTKYGWTDIRNAKPVRASDGWLLKLPRALPLD